MTQEIEILRRVPLFAGLPDAALAALAARLRRRRMPPSTPVVYKGDPAGPLYLIASGKVKVHQATSGGDEVILNVLGPGEFFGDWSLIDGQPRSADISTLENAEFLLLEGDALRETITEQPAVAWTLLRMLSLRLRELNDRAEMLMTRDVSGRVANQLLTLANVHGTLLADGKSIRIDVNLTQSDIAALVGATRERVSRALTGFRSSGAILWDKNAGRWIICKRAILEKRAQM
jgi:CRP/FNR family cyclic AMP-dependent transcriptional regulator